MIMEDLTNKTPLFSVVIPAYNEARGIGKVLDVLFKSKKDGLKGMKDSRVKIIVVDDGSTDKTPEIAGRYKDVKVISHSRNFGYGRALWTGFKASKGDYIAFLDADGSYPPEFVYMLFRRIIASEADIFLGSRLMQGKGKMPLLRYLGNIMFRYIANTLFRSNLTDVTTGMRVFRKEVVYLFESLPYGLAFSPAMSCIAMKKGLIIKEVPIPYKERIGKSKLRIINDGILFLKAIIFTKFVMKV